MQGGNRDNITMRGSTEVQRLSCVHSHYLPVEGVVALLVFLLGEDACFDKGRVRSGVSGSDRLLQDFLTPSRSLTCWYAKQKGEIK